VYCGADGDIGCTVAGGFLGCQLFSARLAEDFSKGSTEAPNSSGGALGTDRTS